MLTVVDISEYQSIKNPSTLKSKADGAILRLGYTGFVSNKPALDKNFETFYKQCKGVGLKVGIYYFTIAFNQSMVDAEANFITQYYRTHEFDFPVFIDIEAQTHSAGWTTLSRSARTSLMVMLIEQLKANGVPVGVYGSTVSTFKNMVDDNELSVYPHWVAEYASSCKYVNPWGWQYTSSAPADEYGINSGSNKLDVSYVYAECDNLEKTTTTNTSSPVSNMPKYGDKTNDVRWLQHILGVDVDGSFGPKTNAALLEYIINTENLKDYLRVHI